DARVLADKPVTPTFLFALLLYGPIAGIIESAPPEHWHELATILEACDRATREAQARLAILRRFALGVREMFALQPRLEHPRLGRPAGGGAPRPWGSGTPPRSGWAAISRIRAPRFARRARGLPGLRSPAWW